MLVTSSSNDVSASFMSNNGGTSEITNPLGSLTVNYSESDLESSEFMPMPASMQLTSQMTSFHKRQAFGMYNLIMLDFLMILFVFMKVIFKA